MWVVKLGGSLAHSPDLNSWLDVFSDPSGIKVVIVPGGGSYADEVRRSQKISGFDDDTAHRMAILAMDKFGLWLCEKTKHFIPAKSAAEIDSFTLKQSDNSFIKENFSFIRRI